MGEDEGREVSRLTVGTPEEWGRFSSRHPLLVDELTSIHQLAESIFGQRVIQSPEDEVIFSLGLLAHEDFEEIFILAGNGLGFGALKLIRGLYERVVTAAYLQRHPIEIKAFVDYDVIRMFRNANEARQAFGADALSKDGYADLKARYEALRDKFMKPCKCSPDCSAVVPLYNWTSQGIPSLAGLVDQGLRDRAPLTYYMALGETHPSMEAVRCREVDTAERGDRLLERARKAHEMADLAIGLAHELLLFNFEIQLDQFPDARIATGPALEAAKEALNRIWSVANQQQDRRIQEQPKTAAEGDSTEIF